MKVINLAVNNTKFFIDKIEFYLCKLGISYVTVENEIHFLDKILRFHEYQEKKSQLISPLLEKEEFIEAIVPPEENVETKPLRYVKKYNISDIKRDNKKTNQRIRSKIR